MTAFEELAVSAESSKITFLNSNKFSICSSLWETYHILYNKSQYILKLNKIVSTQLLEALVVVQGYISLRMFQ